MRSLWTGAVSLSLLNVPVKLGSSSKDNSLGLHMVRKSDGSPIKFKRVAEADGAEVSWGDIAKGYDSPDGSLVILDKDDFDRAYGDKNRTAQVLMFADAADIPPMAVKASYWMQPEKGGEKTYALLASALQSTGKVAVLTFAMRERESVAVMRAHDGYLALETLEWESDLVKPDFAAPPQTATEAEQDLALKLIGQMSGTYDHSAQTDKSTEAVMAVIQAKIETGQTVKPVRGEKAEAAAPVDLMAALTAAVSEKKENPVPAPRVRGGARRKASA